MHDFHVLKRRAVSIRKPYRLQIQYKSGLISVSFIHNVQRRTDGQTDRRQYDVNAVQSSSGATGQAINRR